MTFQKFFSRDVLFEFHLKFWNTASIGFPARSLYKADRLLTGPTAQQKGTTARLYSNKTSLFIKSFSISIASFTSLHRGNPIPIELESSVSEY